MRERAEAYGWKYRGGRTDRDMFICAVPGSHGTLWQVHGGMSQREASEMSGVSNGTASTSLTRMVK